MIPSIKKATTLTWGIISVIATIMGIISFFRNDAVDIYNNIKSFNMDWINNNIYSIVGLLGFISLVILWVSHYSNIRKEKRKQKENFVLSELKKSQEDIGSIRKDLDSIKTNMDYHNVSFSTLNQAFMSYINHMDDKDALKTISAFLNDGVHIDALEKLGLREALVIQMKAYYHQDQTNRHKSMVSFRTDDTNKNSSDEHS